MVHVMHMFFFMFLTFCCGNGKTCESTTYRGKLWYKCIAVDCGRLSDPANGSVTTLGGTVFESLATYTCEEGFILSSTASRTCLSSGLWSFAAPTCLPSPVCTPIECGPLDQPCNGHVDFETAIGGVATYSCELGYELEGESSRVCLDSGEWDGIAPCCIKTCRQGTHEGPTENCACFDDEYHIEWNDRDCTQDHKFVCECPLF